MIAQERFQLDSLSASVERVTSLTADTQGRVVASLAILLGLWVVRWVAVRVVRRRTGDRTLQHRWQKAVTYFTGLIAVLLVGRVWFEAFQSLATFVGLMAAGLAIALRDPILNFAGWAFLLWRRPFVLGDRIQIGEHAGDVIDMRIFQFSLLEIGNWVEADQSTGRIVHVPNGLVFTVPVANYTRGLPYIWNELPVNVTFESDWEKAKRMLLEILQRHCSEVSRQAEERMHTDPPLFPIQYSTLQPNVYTSIEERGVRLTMRYLCEPRRRRGSAEAILEDVLRAFARQDDVAFAYPTRRLVSPEGR